MLYSTVTTLYYSSFSEVTSQGLRGSGKNVPYGSSQYNSMKQLRPLLLFPSGFRIFIYNNQYIYIYYVYDCIHQKAIAHKLAPHEMGSAGNRRFPGRKRLYGERAGTGTALPVLPIPGGDEYRLHGGPLRRRKLPDRCCRSPGKILTKPSNRT